MTLPFALIIEDDTKLAHIFAEALRAAKFETEIIKDGHIAQERIAATTPAVVVLDLHLPEVSGEVILHQIRADERLANTSVMITTADPYLAETLRNEADLVLIKPISFGQLRDLAKRFHPTNQL